MKLRAHTLRGTPASRALPVRLLHTLFVFCATSLMMILAILSFLLVFLLRLVAPAPASRRDERHVTFLLEPKIVITQPPSVPSTPSLSLTATPRELEPPTPDVAEDPLHALSRICGFLASNSARAWRREDLGTTPPLAGLEPYLDAVRVDLERIDEMVAEKRQEEEEEKEGREERATEGSDRQDADADVAPSGGADAGVAAGADAAADDEPDLATDTHADDLLPPPPPPPPSHFPSPPSPLPTHDAPSASTPPITPPAVPAPSTTDNAYPPRTTTTSTPPTTTTTTATANPRTRKDAVLRAARPIADPDHADADADDAAVRAAALLGRFTDLGAGLEGTVRERGAALWTALSGRRTPPDLPVPPPPPRTARTSVALVADPRDVRVVEASRIVAHQAAWRARFATYGRMFGPGAEQGLR